MSKWFFVQHEFKGNVNHPKILNFAYLIFFLQKLILYDTTDVCLMHNKCVSDFFLSSVQNLFRLPKFRVIDTFMKKIIIFQWQNFVCCKFTNNFHLILCSKILSKKCTKIMTKTKPCMQVASLQNIDTETIKIIT